MSSRLTDSIDIQRKMLGMLVNTVRCSDLQIRGAVNRIVYVKLYTIMCVRIIAAE